MADEMKRQSAELRQTVDDVWAEYAQARGTLHVLAINWEGRCDHE